MFSLNHLNRFVVNCRRPLFRKQSRWHRGHQPLVLELLEDRYLLSGNVNAFVSGPNLFVYGDSLGNGVQIAPENGNLVVQGTDNTTVNGSTKAFIAFSGRNRIEGSLFVYLRQGNDRLLVDGGLTIHHSALIFGEDGNDSIGLGRVTIEDNLILFAAGGNDQIALRNTNIQRDAILYAESGNDVFSSLDARIGGSLLLFGGEGNNAISLENTNVNRDALMITGSGEDTISIRNSSVRKNLITVTGSGNDFLHVDPSTVGDRSVVDLGSGNDAAVFTGRNVFTDRAVLIGGSGLDSVEIDAASQFPSGQKKILVESNTVAATLIASRLNDSASGVLSKAAAAQQIFAPTLTVNTDANPTVQSSDTLLTNRQAFTVSGKTSPGATVEIARDVDGVFDDASVVADDSGNYTATVQLAHDDTNHGANNLQVRATNRAGQQATISLAVHYSVGTVVRFQSTLGRIDIELLDDDAPITVANFLNYLDRYVNLIVQRSSKTQSGGDFVIQAGRFTFKGTTLAEVPKDAPIQNEHSDDNPNVRGTLSTALSNDPNSATSEWFINMSDANTFLDAPDRLHTVFGRVIGSGMVVADTIHDLPIQDLNSQFGQPPGGPLSDVPLIDFTSGTPLRENFVRFTSIDVLLIPSAKFGPVTTGSFDDPGLLGIRTDLEPGAPAISDNHLTTAIDYSSYSNPPTYGPHHGPVAGITPRPTGVYTADPPDEDLVHNLEHGNVWISYNPSLLSAADRILLEKLVRDGGEDTGVILTPRFANDSAIALASWAHLLKLDSFDATQIRRFIDVNRGHAPEGYVPSGQKPVNGETLDDGLPHSI